MEIPNRDCEKRNGGTDFCSWDKAFFVKSHQSSLCEPLRFVWHIFLIGDWISVSSSRGLKMSYFSWFYAFRYSITKAFCVAFLMTFFSLFDVPVFWPILLCYWVVLFVLTMKRQITHMIKYRYVPFSIGKQVWAFNDILINFLFLSRTWQWNCVTCLLGFDRGTRGRSLVQVAVAEAEWTEASGHPL